MEAARKHLSSSDATLASIIQQAKYHEYDYRPPEFSTLVRSIVFQQLSGKSARPIYLRVEAACGGNVTPEKILKLHPTKLRKAGLSRQKAAYIRDLAKQTASGKLDFSALPQMKDEEVVEALTAVKGIGEWTAHMFLIFALRRPNVLPTGDYGVRVAIKRAYKKRKLPTPKQIHELAKKNNWHPYCSAVTWYLWRSLEN